MGILLSRFRKKKSTVQQLDDIEQKIKSIEKFQKQTEQKFRRVIGRLIVSSILVYAVAVCGYYYYFTPDSFRENILSFVPLLVFPFVILMSRKILSWYYQRKLSKNESTLKSLKTNKKKILDEVMDKEIYKVAKEILEKYAPEQLNLNSAKNLTSNGNSKALALPYQTPRSDSVARQRVTASTVSRKFDVAAPTPGPANMYSEIAPRNTALAQPRLSLPRPILPRDRGAFDKLVDMIIGDGPGNRYALICRVCSSHNGMALKNEFEYISFHCAYCLQWNPARKQKPQAPNLAQETGSHDESDTNNSETEMIESAEITAESEKSEDVGDKLEPNAGPTNESEIREITPETPDLAVSEATDDDDDDTSATNVPITPKSDDDIDLSAPPKAFDESEFDDVKSCSLPDATTTELSKDNKKNEAIDTETR